MAHFQTSRSVRWPRWSSLVIGAVSLVALALLQGHRFGLDVQKILRLNLSVIDLLVLENVLFIVGVGFAGAGLLTGWRGAKLAVESLLGLAVFAAALRYLNYYAGGALTFDELLYMDNSLFLRQDAHILNRFFHIYLQHLFFWLSKMNPFAGARLYWSFLIALTAGLVYLLARLLASGRSRRTVILQASLALALFFAQPLILTHSGVTYADFTLMALVTLAVALYLLYLRLPRGKALALFALGMVFFFALKTKESGISAAVLFLGLGWKADRLDWRKLAWNWGIVALGSLAGLLCMMAADQALLGDALFGLRPANWQVLFAFNTSTVERSSVNVFEVIAAGPQLAAMALAYTAFFLRRRLLSPEEQVLWAYPLAVLAFFELSMVNGNLDMNPRYLVILSPLIAVLAAQLFDLDLFAERWSARQVGLGGLALAAALLFQFAVLLPAATGKYTWLSENFVPEFIVPFWLLVFAAGLLFLDHRPRLRQFILFASVVSMILFPLNEGLKNFYERKSLAFLNNRFEPLREFKDEIHYSEGMTMYVSTMLYEADRIHCRDQASCQWFFELFFRTRARPQQFTSAAFDPSLLLEQHFNYAFVSERDWRALSGGQQAALDQQYDRARGANGLFYFLKGKSPGG